VVTDRLHEALLLVPCAKIAFACSKIVSAGVARSPSSGFGSETPAAAATGTNFTSRLTHHPPEQQGHRYNKRN
jgi:hypothetical protein